MRELEKEMTLSRHTQARIAANARARTAGPGPRALAPDVQRLEAERLRRSPEPDLFDENFRRLLNLIAAECRRAGYLPRGFRPTEPGDAA